MSVPRCKKKKQNKDERLIKKAERILREDMDKSYNQTAQDMTVTAGAIYHYALERAFGFKVEDDIKLQAEIQKISDEIITGKITIEDIKEHQKGKGFEFA